MKEKGSASFSEEKEPAAGAAKRLLDARSGALDRQRPRPRVIRVFCAAFFQKSGYFL
jgi:hypothetical protein